MAANNMLFYYRCTSDDENISFQGTAPPARRYEWTRSVLVVRQVNLEQDNTATFKHTNKYKPAPVKRGINIFVISLKQHLPNAFA